MRVILLLIASISIAFADELDWMNQNVNSMTSSIDACIEVPEFIGFKDNVRVLEVQNKGNWIFAGTSVEEGKLLTINWSNKSLYSRPAKYKLLYRVDPRFVKPQIFIQKFDYLQNKYLSDFHQFKNGQLLKYQNNPQMSFHQRIRDFDDYFSFIGRSRIPIKADDVVNITLINSGKFFDTDSEMNSELDNNDNPLVIYSTASLDNGILYTTDDIWCKDIVRDDNPQYDKYCTDSYRDTQDNWHTFQGRISLFTIALNNLTPCAENSDGKDNDPLCHYNHGRGMGVNIGGINIKSVNKKFIYSPLSNSYFLYHRSDSDGYLDFTSWSIDSMYNGHNQLMRDWFNIGDYESFMELLTQKKHDMSMNFLHFGRYFMEIEIGGANAITNKEDMIIEYTIAEKGKLPDENSFATELENNFRGNAYSSGDLYLRIKDINSDLTGHVLVKTTSYRGTTWFSDVIYNDIVKPLREKIYELSQLIYEKIISNASFQNIARLMLILYVIFYGLAFLAGTTEIKISDLMERILKIALIVTLFSETSWQFFNDNLFDLLIRGTDYLMNSVIGITSKADNIFGFIDPIFEKYTNPTIWGLLLIQLFQIHNGLTFFALMTIYALLIYFRAIIEIIVSYCLAFLGLAIMISLAPFFIVLILFERTKSIFDNWLSTLFDYMIRPTILLIFFLLIDQILSNQISRVLVRSCWDILIPLSFNIDLGFIGVPISFSFGIPFLPGIPFYVPQIEDIKTIQDFHNTPSSLAAVATSSLLFFAICKLSKGLVDYVTLVVQYLTNVLAARQDGRLQHGSNLVSNIVHDMNNVASSATKPVREIGSLAKEKIIDQKISHRPNRHMAIEEEGVVINKKDKEGKLGEVIKDNKIKDVNDNKSLDKNE